MFDELGARNDASHVVHQVGEQPVFVRGEPDRLAVDDDAAGLGVEPHGAADDLGAGVAGGATRQRAQTGQHFLHVEGLRYVIVGAGVEALHLLAPGVAGGEDQHRHLAAGLAPGLEHRDAVHFRQADVEHDRVVGFRLAEKNRLLAVEGAIDRIARLAERLYELAVQVLVVLDNEQAQSFPLLPTGGDRLAGHGVEDAMYQPPVLAQKIDLVDEAGLAVAEPHADGLGLLLGRLVAHQRKGLRQLFRRDLFTRVGDRQATGLRNGELGEGRMGRAESEEKSKDAGWPHEGMLKLLG